MLTELNINNGILSPKFDIYNDTYTVTITEDIKELDIVYKTDSEDVSVVINGNANLTQDGKIVTITVANGNTIKNIHLNICIEEVASTTGLQNYFEALEVKKEKQVPEYIAPLIGASCFLIIVVVFSILFHKKKKLK